MVNFSQAFQINVPIGWSDWFSNKKNYKKTLITCTYLMKASVFDESVKRGHTRTMFWLQLS